MQWTWIRVKHKGCHKASIAYWREGPFNDPILIGGMFRMSRDGVWPLVQTQETPSTHSTSQSDSSGAKDRERRYSCGINVGLEIRAAPLPTGGHGPPLKHNLEWELIYTHVCQSKSHDFSSKRKIHKTKGVNKLIKYNTFQIYILKIYLILVPVCYRKQILCRQLEVFFLFWGGTKNILNKLKASIFQLIDILWPEKLYTNEVLILVRLDYARIIH